MSYIFGPNEFEWYWWQLVNRCRIIEDKDFSVKLKIKYPTPEQWLRGIEIYKQEYDLAIQDGIRTYNELQKDFINRYNIFTTEDVEEVERLNTEIKQLKRELRRIKIPILFRKKKDEIFEKEKIYYKVLLKKMKYYGETAEGFAENARNIYFAAVCTYRIDENLQEQGLLFKSYEDIKKSCSLEFVKFLAANINSLILGYSHEILRAMARHSYVRVQWRICRKTGINFFGFPVEIAKNAGSLFQNPVIYWTQEQINLCSWLLYYDDVIESYGPPEWLLNDDEKLDRWVEQKVKEKEAERLKSLGTTGRDAYEHEEVIVFGQDKDLIFDEDSPYGRGI